MQEKKCKSCLCYDPKSGYCQVNILINEKKMKLPVFAEDNCHFLELGMNVEQIRMIMGPRLSINQSAPAEILLKICYFSSSAFRYIP